MDDQFENQRLQALLTASRNQMDWMWHLGDQHGGDNRGHGESILKLVGAIDYAPGIETYTLDLDGVASGAANPASSQTAPPAERKSSSASRPLDVS